MATATTTKKTADSKGSADTSSSSTSTPAQKERTKKDIIAAARSHADTVLRNRYREEWNVLVKEQAEKDGVTWEPRKTAEEREKERLEALIAANPDLAAALLAKAQGEGSEDAASE